MAMRLIVIDDNDALRRVVRHAAEPLGWTVCDFADGADFMRNVTIAPAPRLILVDTLMANADGIETILWLARETDLRCPIAIMTGGPAVNASAAEAIAAAHGFPVLGVLLKPVGLAEIRALLDRAAQR